MKKMMMFFGVCLVMLSVVSDGWAGLDVAKIHVDEGVSPDTCYSTIKFFILDMIY